MEWLNHSAGFRGLGMSSTGSSHCRQYIVSFFWRRLQREIGCWWSSITGCLKSLKEDDVADSGWRDTSPQQTVRCGRFVLSDRAGVMQEQVKDARRCCRQVIPGNSRGQRRKECESGHTSAATNYFNHFFFPVCLSTPITNSKSPRWSLYMLFEQ